MKLLSYAVIFGVIGLVVGYFLFARFAGHYLSVMDLFFNDKGIAGQLGDAIAGGEKIRRNIFISGGIGGAIGLLLSSVNKSRR